MIDRLANEVLYTFKRGLIIFFNLLSLYISREKRFAPSWKSGWLGWLFLSLRCRLKVGRAQAQNPSFNSIYKIIIHPHTAFSYKLSRNVKLFGWYNEIIILTRFYNLHNHSCQLRIWVQIPQMRGRLALLFLSLIVLQIRETILMIWTGLAEERRIYWKYSISMPS